MLNRNLKLFPILTTERLTLRKPTIYDEDDFFILRSSNEINKYLDRQVCKTIEEARDFIKKVNESLDQKNTFYWTITLTDRNIMVGTICLFNFSDKKDKCEIGYELLTNYQRQGIMKEAAQRVLHFAFYTLHVQSIEAFTHKDNLGSIKLLEQLSFKNTNLPSKSNPVFICYQLTKSFDNLK